MKVEINQTIDPKKVTVYSHRTGKYIDTIPTEGVMFMKNLGGACLR